MVLNILGIVYCGQRTLGEECVFLPQTRFVFVWRSCLFVSNIIRLSYISFQASGGRDILMDLTESVICHHWSADP